MTNQDANQSSELQELLRGFTVTQLRWLVARMECNSDAEAARMIGINKNTVTQWGEPVKRAVILMAQDGVITALELQRRALPKAMAVKVAGLDSDNERIRQDVATELIERNLGKPTEKHDISGSITYSSGL